MRDRAFPVPFFFPAPLDRRPLFFIAKQTKIKFLRPTGKARRIARAKEGCMTPQEAQMLQQLVQQVESTQLNEKDPAAEALLKDTLGRDPDALYKLAQTVLVQDIALHQAQAKIRELIAQQQAPVSGIPQPARASSFLGGVIPQSAAAVPSSGTPAYQPVNAPPAPAAYPGQYGYQNAYPAQPSYVAAPSAGSSFLRSAATTAAGVAAGALAFEGIESLFHGGMGFGSPFGFGGGAPVEETVINNYYDDPAAGSFAGQDMQPQGAFDSDNGGGLNTGFDPGFDPGFDQGMDGGDFDNGGFNSGDDLI
jgi:hypothetical protein